MIASLLGENGTESEQESGLNLSNNVSPKLHVSVRKLTGPWIKCSFYVILIKVIYVSRNGQYKDVYRRTIEISQRTGILKAYCYLKVHNVHNKLTLLLSR